MQIKEQNRADSVAILSDGYDKIFLRNMKIDFRVSFEIALYKKRGNMV